MESDTIMRLLRLLWHKELCQVNLWFNKADCQVINKEPCFDFHGRFSWVFNYRHIL